MFRRLWDVHNKYKAELVVSSSVADGGNNNLFHRAKQRDKPRPLSAQMNHNVSKALSVLFLNKG